MPRQQLSNSHKGQETQIHNDGLKISTDRIVSTDEQTTDSSDSDSSIDHDGDDDQGEIEAADSDADETSSSSISTSSEDEARLGEEQGSLTKRQTTQSQPSDLKSKISAFLPQIAKANKTLTMDNAARIDNVSEDEEHYIEMNLGLGVLKEKPNRKRNDGIRLEETSNSSDISSSSDSSKEELQENSTVLDKLKGQKTGSNRKRKIEELG